MTHPITPPPELAAKWVSEIYGNDPIIPLHDITLRLVERAAQWGADQELEACCEWLGEPEHSRRARGASELRAARRPKPTSLKEQALLAIDTAVADDRLSADVANVVRRALEQLND